MDFQDVEGVLEKAIEVISEHQGLINAYVTDFFVGARREVSAKWLTSFSRLQPWEMGSLMLQSCQKSEDPFPLLDDLPPSLVDFLELCRRLNINDGSVGDVLFSPDHNSDSWVGGLGAELRQCSEQVPPHLRKVMKPKKQHEVVRQGQAISAAANAIRVRRVVDIGAGHGHLARFLAFQHDLEVTAIEASDRCAPKASKLDREVFYRLKNSDTNLPHHVTSFVSEDPALKIGALQSDQHFALTGLHACGDLTPTLLRHFCSDSCARALVSVGCCYMRCGQPWVPMSRRVRDTGLGLSFEGLELACHHLESYRSRLSQSRSSGHLGHLKGQAYRAGFTVLLAKCDHRLQHGTGVRCGLKPSDELTFRRYAESLIDRLGLSELQISENDWDEVEQLVEREWRSVVAFSALRLMLAPVVELVILLDRLLFLRDQGISNSCLVRLFDSSQSPRNIAILSWKD